MHNGDRAYLEAQKELAYVYFVQQKYDLAAVHFKIVTEDCSNLSSIHGLHVYTNSDKSKELQKADPCLTSIYLKIPGLSQMTLNHVRHADLCSPTSTTAVTRYLSLVMIP